jgi:poly-gamma-glutamate capsule biosynthesis protein CapA/YwtB (metallophosphatase superfamily)
MAENANIRSRPGNLTLVASGDSLIVRRLPQPLPRGLAVLAERIRSADVSFTNLETILRRDEGFPQAECGGSTWIWSDPEVLADLHDIGFKLFGTAQNHMLDWGQEGLLACVGYLDAARAVHAGAGANLAEARRPAYCETPQGRIALIAATSTFREWNRAGAARSDCLGRPGINPLRVRPKLQLTDGNFRLLRELSASLGLGSLPPQVKSAHATPRPDEFVLFDHVVGTGSTDAVTYEIDTGDRTAIVNAIAEAKRQADWVLFSFHSHEMEYGDPELTPDHLRGFMQSCIDAGADAVIAHGAHLLRGIEIYQNRPIIHGLGNFFFENEMPPYQPSDFYERVALGPDAVPADGFDKRTDHDRRGFPADSRFWEGALATCTWSDGELASLAIHPVLLGHGEPRPRRGRPAPAVGDVGRRIVERMRDMSERYGVEISWNEKDGSGLVRLSATATGSRNRAGIAR